MTFPGRVGISVDNPTPGAAWSPDYLTISTEDVTPALKGTASFGPEDGDSLTSPGSFSFTGPAGLNVSFTAGIGTTGAELASELAALINAAVPSYAAVADGYLVTYTIPQAGTMAFSPSGQGIVYDLTAVPEPSALILSCRASSVFLST